MVKAAENHSCSPLGLRFEFCIGGFSNRTKTGSEALDPLASFPGGEFGILVYIIVVVVALVLVYPHRWIGNSLACY